MEKLQSSKVFRKHGHGRYIYAYCHINTNQVVYSLTQTLHNHSTLKQLPDLGANNKPTALRKDLWRPFFTVILPDSDEGKAQGLHAYKKLLEWRKLHETSWTPSPLLSRPYTQNQIDEIKQRLEDRGGSKTESAYDVIRREKKKMRIREARDQKANSVADLATVLIDQEVVGNTSVEERQQEKEQMVKEMLALYTEVKKEGIQKLRDEIKMKKAEAQKLKQEGQVDKLVGVRKTISILWDKNARMHFAADIVLSAKRELKQEEREEREREEIGREEGDPPQRDLLEEEQPLQVKDQAENPSPDTATPDPVPTEVTEEERLTPEERSRIEKRTRLEKKLMELLISSSTLDSKHVPKRGYLRGQLRRASRPVFTMKGVRVSWQNMLDAEFASEWPDDVEHSVMGFARHTAPKAGSEPMLKVLDVKELREIKDTQRDAWRERRNAAEAQIWKDGGSRSPELERLFKRRTGPVQRALMKMTSDAFKERREEKKKRRDEAAQQESA